jgi:hypothetical protein
MKIKQTTSLILMLTMLVLNTSCGKSTSVNPTLPIHKTPDANINQSVPAEETWIEWGRRNWKYITATALYVAFTEWRIYKIHAKANARNKKTKSRMASQFRKITSVSMKVDNMPQIPAKIPVVEETPKNAADPLDVDKQETK